MAFTIGERRGSLKRLIGDFKFKSQAACARPIVELLSAKLRDLPTSYVIVPIPTIAPHIRTRGFDHTKLLARLLARRTGARYQTDLLFRADNLVQHSLSKKERLQVKDSIQINLRATLPRKVLLLDDIWTTGATLTSVAQKLKKAGVRDIALCAILRQPDK